MVLKLIVDSHEERDFTQIYKFLVTKYGNDSNCPAVLLLDDVEPDIFQTPFRESIVFLNRNSDRLLRDLKKTLSKRETKIDLENMKQLMNVYATGCNYNVWYTWFIEICEYLRISMPAIYMVEKQMSQLSEYTGAVLPGNKPYVTDMFVKLDSKQSAYTLKVCLHELRHVWQHKYHGDWFEEYVNYSDSDRKEDYYKQKAELEADAFAYWTLEENGVKFILEDLGMERCFALRNQMEEFRNSDQKPLHFSYFNRQE